MAGSWPIGLRWRALVALFAVLAIGLLPAAAAPAGAVAPGEARVFVNEVHYDNDGTDVGEAIEIAGPAGTDLTGWSIVLYNGTGGAAYGTRALAVTIPDHQAGFGTVLFTYPSNGIQNGSPDGMALVDPGGQVVQLLSYEGSFTAVGGPAGGLASTDVGVVEGSGTPLGWSLQLTGSGDSYGDFTWAAPAAASFGTVNVGQAFGEGAGGEPGPEPCDVPVTSEIGGVQGPGDTSPLVGQTATVEGVVVGDFQAGGQLGGVFIQDADGDGNAATPMGSSCSTHTRRPSPPETSSGAPARWRSSST